MNTAAVAPPCVPRPTHPPQLFPHASLAQGFPRRWYPDPWTPQRPSCPCRGSSPGWVSWWLCREVRAGEANSQGRWKLTALMGTASGLASVQPATCFLLLQKGLAHLQALALEGEAAVELFSQSNACRGECLPCKPSGEELPSPSWAPPQGLAGAGSR